MVIAIVAVLACSILPTGCAFADDDFGGGRGSAVALGWVAIGAGLVANISLLLYVGVKRASVMTLGGGHEITRGLAVQHPVVVNFHMWMNLVGFAAGAAHGIVLLGGLDATSLSLAIVMTVLVVSGIALRFSSRNARLFAKMLHGQIVLSAILVILVVLHVLSMGGFD
ncbi:MAG TPA: hypothetical protein VF172_13715 [Nitrososphaera sp.]